MNRRNKFSRKLICVMFFTALLFSNVVGQRKGGQVASAKGPAAPKCSGAWTGSIVYSRTQSMTDNKTVDRVSGRGKDTRDWEMKYDYRAQVAVIEDPLKNGSSNGRATVKHNLSSIEKVEAVESNSCDRGKTWKDMRGTSTSTTKTTGSEAGVESNINVGVNADGTYSVSVAIPQIRGEVTGSQTSTYSGQCTPKEGKNFTMPPTVTTIDGNSLTSDGTNRINPEDPNKISGSYSKTWQNVTETITWNLQKCGAPLRIIDLKFEDMKFPNWDDWREISEQTGTIDGNWVKVKAKVLNASGETKYGEVSFKETFKGDKYNGAMPDVPLKDNTVSVRLDAGEEREVEILWDTSGYSWFDDGRPRLVQRVKAELWENNKLIDNMTKNIKVAPRPLVLVHGLWSNWKAWETWQNILTTSHSYDWKAFPVGEKADKGVMNTGGGFLSSDPTNSIAENARELENYIKYAQEDRNAWHVDIVAHSMGGLISRYYISQIMPGNTPDGRPKVYHLVMLGTPNMGSPCADVMNFAFELLGKNVEAVRQLQQDYVAGFNRINTNRKGVKFSVLAGDPLPTMCKSVVWNDGVVPVPSAIWQIADNAKSKSLHTDLTGTSDFSNFVKPRVAVGPRGNHMPEMPTIPGQTGMRVTGEGEVPVSAKAREFVRSLTPRVYGAGVAGLAGMLPVFNPAESQPSFAKSVRVAAKQIVEIEIPVGAASNLGLTFMADPMISAALVDDKGAAAGKNLARSPESRGWFRSIYYDRPTTAGTWKLKLENTGDLEYEAVVTTWNMP